MQLEIEGNPIFHPCEVVKDFAECFKTVFRNFAYATFLLHLGTHNTCPYILSLIWTFVKRFTVYEVHSLQTGILRLS
jgi:hypothetical protein